MNGNEKLYEAVTGLSDDVIESAGGYKFAKKKSLAWIAYAAAACLALGLGIFGVSRMAKKPVKPIEAAIPTEQQTEKTPTARPEESPVIEKTVLYGDGKTNKFDDESYPNPGTTNISYPLRSEILKEENADCLFAVRIGLTHVYDELWTELNETWRECIADPDYQKYANMYNEWEWDKFKEMLPDEIAAYYGLSYEEFENNEGGLSKRYILMNADFQEYLKDLLPAEEFDRCVAAFDRLTEIDDEMWGSRERIGARVAEVYGNEYERLSGLGLEVELDETGLVGYLSGEQIADFPCSGLYGYCFYWIGADNIMDE